MSLKVIIVNGTTTELTDATLAVLALLGEVPTRDLNRLKVQWIGEEQRRRVQDLPPSGPVGSKIVAEKPHTTS